MKIKWEKDALYIIDRKGYKNDIVFGLIKSYDKNSSKIGWRFVIGKFVLIWIKE